MDLIKALNSRYATKKFDPTKKLSDEVVNQVIEAARLTPTSYGMQLMKLVVVENPKLRELLVSASFGQNQVKDSSHLLVLCREKEVEQIHIDNYISNIAETREQEFDQLSGFKNALEKSILTKSAEQNGDWMNRQVYIALGNILTSCAVLGIDSCPMEGFVPEEYDRILNLEDKGLKSVLVIPIGFRAADDYNAKNKKVRRSTADFLVRI
ncbi:MAG: NAD(P)H-dependent oxidoreductase [Crocinitomicaceae bacterium]